MEKKYLHTLCRFGVLTLVFLFVQAQGNAQCNCPTNPITVELDNNGEATFNGGFILGDQLELGDANNSKICVNVTTDFSFTWNLIAPNPNQDLFFYSIGGPDINLSDTPAFPSSGTQNVTVTSGQQFCLTAINNADAKIQFLPGLTGELDTANWTLLTGIGDFTLNDNCTVSVDGTTLNPDITLDCNDIGNNYEITLFDGTMTTNCGTTNTVRVVDNTPPIFDMATVPVYLDPVQCNAIADTLINIVTPTAIDNCPNMVTVTRIMPDLSGKSTDSLVSEYYNYFDTIRWVAEDMIGNKDTVQTVISIVDNIAPIFNEGLTPMSTNYLPTVIDSFANPITCQSSPITLKVVTDLMMSPNLTDNCTPPDALMALITNNAPVGDGLADASGIYPVGSTVVEFSISEPSGLPAVVHTVTINVTEPGASITVAVDSTDVICKGASTGAIDITPSGGSGVYTYNWSNMETTQDISGLPAGTYSVTVSDGVSCPVVISNIGIDEPANSLIATLNPINQDTICNGMNTGAAEVTGITNGTAPYSYQWENLTTATILPQITSNLTGLAAGNYKVVVTDSLGCTWEDTFIVTSGATLAFDLPSGVTNVTCNGGNDGAITVLAEDGSMPYTYTYQGTTGTATTQNSQNITGLSADTYSITVTDANGCTITETGVVIDEPAVSVTATSSSTAATCNGSSDGTITATGAEGTAPYMYQLQNSLGAPLVPATGFQATGSFTALAAGTYIVLVQDANNCTTSTTTTVTEPANGINITLTKSDITCNGLSNGSVTASISGGTTPYTNFAWSNGSSGISSINGLGAGTYTLSITDSNNCTATQSIEITSPPALALNTDSTNVTCLGANDGSIVVTIAGGTMTNMAYPSISWTSPNGTFASDTNISSPYIISNLPPGTYTITVLDANSCTPNTTTATINSSTIALNAVVDTNPMTTNSVLEVACNTPAPMSTLPTTGEIEVISTGGTGSMTYTYLWSNGTTANPAVNLSAGIYTVTVSDANGCTTTVEQAITAGNDNLLVDLSITDSISCNGANDGELTVTVSGGAIPIASIEWQDGFTSPATSGSDTRTGLSPITYSVTVTDAMGCSVVVSNTIMDPPTVSATATATNVSCNGTNGGSATVTAGGGTGSFTYLWSNGQTTAMATSLAAGTHTVTVSDGNMCTETAMVTITQPTAIVSNIAVTQISNCLSPSSNASISLAPTGGTGPYTYMWSSGQTTANITSLAAGTYTVTVTDANMCTITETATISAPAGGITAAISNTTNICSSNDGSLTVSPSGGNTPYTYQWNDAAAQTTATASGLAANTYSVTVTDAFGCTTTATGTITAPMTTLAVTVTPDPVDCFNTGTGSAMAMASGGTGPYTFLWSDGQTTSLASNLVGTVSPGTLYTVTVTDAVGCTTVGSGSVTQAANVPSVSLTSITNITDCTTSNSFDTDGAIDISVSGGAVGGYTFLWSNGETTEDLSNTNTPPNGVTSAGNYSVQVTDANGCTIIGGPFMVEENETVNATLSVTDIGCGSATGAIDVTIGANVTGPITYLWSNASTSQDLNGLSAGTYTVLIKDGYGCTINPSATISNVNPITFTTSQSSPTCPGESNGNASAIAMGGTGTLSYSWSTGSTGNTSMSGVNSISGLSAGTYTVTASDNNGCTGTSEIIVSDPSFIIPNLSSTNVTCNGLNDGTIHSNPFGGTPGGSGYSYNWNTGSTSQSLSGLSPGSYVVTVTDNNGCAASSSVVITEPSILSSAITSSNISCNGGSNGSIDLTVSGGLFPYSYLWTNGSTNQDLNSLTSGTYVVTITDGNGCTATNSVSITEPAAITVSFVSTNVVCNGESNGTATPTATNGTAQYTFDWGTTDPTMLAAGTYTVTVMDASSCTGTGSVTITEPNAFAVTATSTDALCQGEATGTATPTGTGGTSPYSFDWGTATPTALTAGTYTVTATDANMCTATTSVTISEPSAALAPNIDNFNDISCNGANDGNATSNPTGGTMPYDWIWSTGSASQSIFNLQPATYTVTVTDGNGCTSSEEVVITEPTVLTSTWMVTDALCNGANDGSIDFNVVGGTAPYTYDWDNDGIGDYDDPQDLSNLSPGTYNVTVQDANGCTVEDMVPIGQPANAITIVTTPSNILCNGGTGSATAVASGGTSPFIYDWGTADPTMLAAGTYTVTATDANMCSATSSVTITQPANALTVTTTGTNILCNGSSTGNATATATGGTSPYSFDWGSTDPTMLAAGTYTVTVTDANMCSATSSVTITEPTALTASAVATSIACSTGTGADIDLTVSNGTSPYTYLWSTNATTEDISGLGEGVYTVTITDANMCTITSSATVTNTDTQMPFSTNCPTDTMMVNDAGSCGAIFTYAAPTFDDNCDGTGNAGTLVAGLASGSLFPVGATAVTYEYTDAAGNGPVQCTFVVIVSDTEAPMFDSSDPNAPSDGQTVIVDSNGGCNAIYSYTSPVIVDNCMGGTIISQTYSNSVTLGLGTYTNTIIAQDAAGNIDSITYTFQIQDLSATPPTAICHNSIAVTIPAGQQDVTIPASLINNGSFGNCGPVTLSVSPNVFTCAQADGVTPYNIALTVTDNNGLSTTCNTTITIQENSAPTMVCQDITVELDANGNAFITPDTIDNGSSDGCIGLANLSLDVNSFNASNVGIANPVTLTGTDVNGNSASCTANVSVEIPKPCLDIPDNFMVGTGVNCIPVTVTNFTNVRSFQESIYIDPAVAEFMGICSHNLQVAPNVSVDNDTLTISYFSNATTLLDGDVVFEIQVNVVGTLNSTSNITVGNDPTPQEVIVEYGGTVITLSAPFCSTQDGSLVVANSSLSATGNVRTWDLTDANGNVLMMTQPVNNVDVFKTENGGTLALGGTTDINGDYSVSASNLSGGINLELTPLKNVNWLNYDPFPVPQPGGPSFQGVTSFDLFTIQQHIVTNAPLISNYQLIAADANGDGQISTLDLVLLQDIIVGNSSSISSNQSWRFVPASDSLHNDPLPFLPNVPAFNDPISFNGFTSNMSNVDWIAVKIGNVVGPVVTSNLTANTVDTRTGSDLQFVIEDKQVKSGELLEIPFYAKDFKHVASQFTFEFNESVLRYENMVPNSLSNFNEGNLGLEFANNGKLSAAWFATELKDIADDEILFTLQFEVLENGKSLSELLSISNRLVKSEAYQLDGSVGDVAINFVSPAISLPSTFELFQNTPNPFSEKTTISFNLVETGFAKLTLYDVSGRILKVVEGDYEKGFNQIEISSNNLPSSGIVYYKLESANNTATKKMIVLK